MPYQRVTTVESRQHKASAAYCSTAAAAFTTRTWPCASPLEKPSIYHEQLFFVEFSFVRNTAYVPGSALAFSCRIPADHTLDPSKCSLCSVQSVCIAMSVYLQRCLQAAQHYTRGPPMPATSQLAFLPQPSAMHVFIPPAFQSRPDLPRNPAPTAFRTFFPQAVLNAPPVDTVLSRASQRIVRKYPPLGASRF